MCVGWCKRLFFCSYGGGTRDDAFSSPVREEGVWPRARGVAWTGSDARGRSFLSESSSKASKEKGAKRSLRGTSARVSKHAGD